MPRPALTEEQRRQIRRNIREAAARLHKDNGLSNISVRAVAQEAGVSVGTVYSRFGSLSELMQSLWRRPARKLVQRLTHLADEISDPVEQLRAYLTAYVQFSIAEPEVFRAAFLFVRPESAEPPPQVALKNDRFFQLYRTTIREGQRSGVFRDGDLDELTQLLLSAIHGSVALPINLHRLALDPSPRIPNLMVRTMLEWLERR